MKKLAFTNKIYDYTSIKEAENHMEKMIEKGWCISVQEDGKKIYENSTDDYPYSVEYYK